MLGPSRFGVNYLFGLRCRSTRCEHEPPINLHKPSVDHLHTGSKKMRATVGMLRVQFRVMISPVQNQAESSAGKEAARARPTRLPNDPKRAQSVCGPMVGAAHHADGFIWVSVWQSCWVIHQFAANQFIEMRLQPLRPFSPLALCASSFLFCGQ